MSETLINRLIEFAESGNQQKICLKNHIYQGWVMEVSEDFLLMSTGYAEKKGQDIKIQINDLLKAELYFWNHTSNQWILFTL